MIDEMKRTVTAIREKKPLVLCLTNYVTMDFMANSLLALGAAPVMSEAEEEVAELIALSQVVYINLGTVNEVFAKRAHYAVEQAKTRKKPIVLDPVGAGASHLRTSTALSLVSKVDVIRGNASEIMSLSGIGTTTRGVETAEHVSSAMSSACIIAERYKNIVAISGAEDFITDLNQEHRLNYGSSLMPLITGMGCTLTAVISAFVCCSESYYQGTVHALTYFSLCGQYVAQNISKPGTFRQHFIDALYEPNWDFFSETLEI